MTEATPQKPASEQVAKYLSFVALELCVGTHRSYAMAARVVPKILVEDRLVARVVNIAAKMGPERVAQVRKDIGSYSMFHVSALMDRPEVRLALELAAHNISPATAPLRPATREALADPVQRKKITRRFPRLTAQRIQSILAF